MAEMVGAELQLKAVSGSGQGRHHHAGVVDQHIDIALPRGGELAHGGEVRKVEPANLGLA